MPCNQRAPNPLPGSPLFDNLKDACAWVAKHRPAVLASYYYQHETDVWAAEELPADHPLRRGAIVFSVNRPKPEKPQSRKPGEE